MDKNKNNYNRFKQKLISLKIIMTCKISTYKLTLVFMINTIIMINREWRIDSR